MAAEGPHLRSAMLRPRTGAAT